MTRTAFITGATAGIGAATARALAGSGWRIVITGRRADRLDALVAELGEDRAYPVVLDMRDGAAIDAALAALPAEFGAIDLLVNNAGFGTAGAFIQQEWSSEQQLVEVNILALARLCHALGQRMVQQGGGQILNVASVAAFNPGPWMSTYYASKAYVLHFSEALRVELKQSAVKVSVLCPGPTRTAFFRTAQLNSDKLKDSKMLMSPEEVALYTVRALEKNRAIIIPGRRNRWFAFLPRLGSRWLNRTIVGMVNKAYCPR